MKMARTHFSSEILVLLLCMSVAVVVVESGIGVNWGTVALHRLSPGTVVDLLKDNKITKVKLFDADPNVLKALMGSGIEVMVGIPNEMLALLSTSTSACDLWVSQNVSRYMVKGGVDIRYIAVGNEPFLTSYSGQFQSYVVPALTNLQQSLAKANLAGTAKLVVPCNADAYESSLPSQGAFRPELAQIMTQLVSFLNSNGSPFVVNIYPFLSLYGNSDFPQDYAFFQGTTHPVVDGPNIYYNAFDGNFDTLVAALSKLGYPQMPIVIGEVGWPTDGAPGANLSAARAFNQGLVYNVLNKKGTPLRPGVPPMDVYLFSLLDEGAKSTLPGNFERHWGMFSFDGQAKYQLNLGNGLLKNAKEVQYLPSRWCVANPTRDLSAVASHFKLACSYADCTTLTYGGSCNDIGEKGNISYAFNSYYQLQKQNPRSCEFDGLGMVTFLDPSVGNCRVDLKPANILLDANFVSKLSDFGICRKLPQDELSENNTTVCCKTDPKGTLAYIDPEFLSTGELTLKSDVYSFGIILLRLLTGRPALGITKEVQYALDKGNLKDLLDPTAGDWPFVQAKQLAYLALSCSDMNRKRRPDLASEVWRVLDPMKISCGVSSLRFGSEEHYQIPSYFICPIFQEIMQDPVVAADGFTYELEALKGWLESGHDTSPMTNLKLPHCDLVPNHALRSAIQEWLQQP